MIRPEAKVALLRFREALMGAGLVLLGGWWLLGPGQLLTLPALALIIAGSALIWIGLQRARFRNTGEGPGAVSVTEGQIAYFGPTTGGAVALSEVSSLALDRSVKPAQWRLDQPGRGTLNIPVNAAGADALFDAFATLPGLQTERMLSALNTKSAHQTVIWQRDLNTHAHLPLH